ncbi:hypothetical protein GQ600_13694 [Phytophthora cactorum]|nr:hypothetical protein GQ600_13694 [Phytophthora cactorum]
MFGCLKVVRAMPLLRETAQITTTGFTLGIVMDPSEVPA